MLSSTSTIRPRNILRLQHGSVCDGTTTATRPSAQWSAILQSLQPFGVHQSYSRNETVFIEGADAEELYQLTSGALRLCRHMPNGRRHIADFVLRDDVFGLEDRSLRTFTAEAVGASTVTRYPRAQFEKLAALEPRAVSLHVEHLERGLANSRHLNFAMSCQNARERVASFIIRLSARTNTPTSGCIDLPMGRQDIADHLGLTIETVSRALTGLKRDGFLAARNSHRLILSNMRDLRQIAIAT